jgi:hypothetical protein
LLERLFKESKGIPARREKSADAQTEGSENEDEELSYPGCQ